MFARPRSRSAMSLIEVIVSTVILGVVSIAYAGLFRAQIGQRDGYEELGFAMEIAVRQIEYLRQVDLTRPTVPLAAAPYDRVPPYGSIYNGYGPGGAAVPCPDANNMVYDSTKPNNPIDAAFGAGIVHPMREFLTSPVRRNKPASTTMAVAEGNGCILPDRSTVGPPNVVRTTELVLPDALVARGYSVAVRASRVRSENVDNMNPKREFESFLVHYQINVFRNDRPILVVPFVRAVDM